MATIYKDLKDLKENYNVISKKLEEKIRDERCTDFMEINNFCVEFQEEFELQKEKKLQDLKTKQKEFELCIEGIDERLSYYIKSL